MTDFKYIDLVLKALSEKYPNHLNLKEYFQTLFPSNEEIQHNIRREVIDILRNENLAEENQSNPGHFKITNKGRDVAKNGFNLYLNNLEEVTNKQKHTEALTYEKLKYDVKNAKRIYRTYWFTFWFAVVGLLISLSLLILKVMEWTN